MPNNIRRESAGGELADLRRRLERIENVPQSGHTSILNGTLDVLDADGRIVMMMGVQDDGTVGLALFDPVTHAKVLQLGQQPDGSFGLGQIDPANAANYVQLSALAFGIRYHQVLTAQSTTSLTPADLATVGPTVTVMVGSTGRALVNLSCGVENNGSATPGYVYVGVAIDGTMSAPNDWLDLQSNQPSTQFTLSLATTRLIEGLSSGPHVFTAKYWKDPGPNTGLYFNRLISVQPL